MDIVKYWSDGRKKAMAYLKESEVSTCDEIDIDKTLKEEPGVDMLRPYCQATSVRVLSGDRTVYDLLDADPSDDEYTEVDVFPGDN